MAESKNKLKREKKGENALEVPYRKYLDPILPYKPARTIESARHEFGFETVIKLAGNENNHGYSPLVVKAIQDSLQEIARYPDVEATALRKEITSWLSVSNHQILFGNGSFELISLIAQAFLEKDSESIIPTPSFGWYYIATVASGGTPKEVKLTDFSIDLNTIYEEISDNTRLIWLCNPNNPTGTYFNANELDDFLTKIPGHILVVLDEAYADYADTKELPKTNELIQKFDNIICLRTFSKAYGLASLRIGYALANEEIIKILEKIKQPSNISLVAQEAAVAALKDRNFYEHVLRENEKGRNLYYKKLKEWDLPYIPSQGNFILFDTKEDSTKLELWYLKHGIFVRNGLEFGLEGWLRITIGTETENNTVLNLFQEYKENFSNKPESS